MQKQQNANVKTSYSLELWRIRFDNSNQTKSTEFSFRFIYSNGINQEKLESCLVFIFQFFHLNFPPLVFFPLAIQFSQDTVFLHIHRLLCISFGYFFLLHEFIFADLFFSIHFFFFVRSLLVRNFLIFLSLMYRFLAQTKDKEVYSICSEYIINIFPWIKFIFFKVVLLLKILKIFQLCFVSSERIQKKEM